MKLKDSFLDIDFYLLLLYSLLPGIGKIIGFQNIMIAYVGILFYWWIKQKNKIYISDIPFILFLLFLILYTLLSFGLGANKSALILGVGLDLIPMSGYFLFREYDFERLCRNLILVVLVHGLIGIYLYPFFGIANFSNPKIQALIEGVAWGRMSSVSGSLGFGNLIMVGFILCFYWKKLLAPIVFCLVIFSMQRSAWVGSAAAVLLYMYFLMKKGDAKRMSRLVFVILVLILFVIIIVPQYIDFDFSYLIKRFSELFSGVNENGGVRTSLWQNGIDNFKSNPLGAGIGQVGQIGTRFENTGYKVCPDGDYFRMLSEYGINFVVFVLSIIFCFMCLILFYPLNREMMCAFSVSAGSALQLIGSNITEFYFDNFIFWIFIGLNMYNAKELFHKEIVRI